MCTILSSTQEEESFIFYMNHLKSTDHAQGLYRICKYQPKPNNNVRAIRAKNPKIQRALGITQRRRKRKVLKQQAAKVQGTHWYHIPKSKKENVKGYRLAFNIVRKQDRALSHD